MRCIYIIYILLIIIGCHLIIMSTSTGIRTYYSATLVSYLFFFFPKSTVVSIKMADNAYIAVFHWNFIINGLYPNIWINPLRIFARVVPIDRERAFGI